MAPWPPISRDDLRHAAGSAGFDTDFPLLIRRLIAETGREVTDLDMPGGSGTAAGGFDGVVVAGKKTSFVPAGLSVWELSVQQGAQAKADQDYAKRSTGPTGEDPSAITYVQVILAAWTKARNWAASHGDEQRWREVRAYNLDQVHTWLDTAPATMAWLAARLGKAVPGVRHTRSWWEDTWIPSTKVPLTAELVLAGRDTAAASLANLLASGKKTITVGGDLRTDELHAFVAAAQDRTSTAHSERPDARTLLVRSSDSLAQFLGQPQPLVFVVPDAKLLSDLPHAHPHQIVMPAALGGNAAVDVPRVDGETVSELLITAGITRERAYMYGTLARRSVPALRRALALQPEILTPTWAQTPGPVTRRLLLIAAWNGLASADRELLEDFLGRAYAEVHEAALALMSEGEDPFLGVLQEHWHVISAEDSWHLLAPHLTVDDLDGFRRVARQVLSEERQQDSGFGVVRPIDRTQFSIFLRRGVAASLAVLGSSDDLIRLPGGATGSEVARQIVAEVFDAANNSGTYGLWSSVSDVLPLLVEAAPDEFLLRVGVGLRGTHPLHRAMFTDDRATAIGMPTPSAHLDFVRALETLAWSPDHFDDAVDVLAKLAVIDPGGKWSNRPAASLTGIFSCWHPNTTADEEQRIGALRRLLRSTPEVARNLLVSLIPTNHMTQTPHSGPRFRDWRREQRITHEGLRHAVDEVVDILLDDLDGDPDRYLSVIRKIEHISSSQRDRLAHLLTELAETITDDDARRRLRDALHEKIAHHREFATSDWAMPEDEFRCLDQAVSAFVPRTIILRVAWLFSSGGPALSDRSRREDSAAYAVAVRERRAEAIGQVLAEHGHIGIETLARMTDYPYLVGVALSDHTSDFDVPMLGKLAEGPPMQMVAHAYLQSRLFREGESLRDRLLDLSGSPAEQAAVLNASADASSAWRALHGLSPKVSELYWKTFSHHGIPSITTDVTAAAVGLLGVRRYTAVVDLVSLHAEEIDSIEVAELAATACEGMLVEPPSVPEMHMLSEYDFQRVFAMLARHRDTIGHQRVATLEWHLFPFLGFQAEAPTLHATLSDEPSFFAELVCRVYRRDDEDLTEPRVENEERERMATRAFEVLRSWRRCPGVSADGTVDLGMLRVWTVDARERLREAGRACTGDSQIGQAFAYAPSDQDDLFPPRAVRDLLEELASEDIDRGLNIGIFNKRGIVSRGMTDGGAQERSLAGAYRQRAAESNLWPRTRRILRELAETYEHHARREEEVAEHRRRGLPD